FFQAEDGIRDFHVTGVQTCALPISVHPRIRRLPADRHPRADRRPDDRAQQGRCERHDGGLPRLRRGAAVLRGAGPAVDEGSGTASVTPDAGPAMVRRTSTLSSNRPQDYKAVLGRFCTGVTVVTALDGDTPVGFTCQSFSALSLQPPLIL